MNPQDMAGLIDHTALKPDTDETTVQTMCAQALQHGFASVCVNPRWVQLVSSLLGSSPVATCVVIGFPLGATTTATKVAETTEVVAQGANEVDMVIDIAAANAGERIEVTEQIAAVVAAAHAGGALVKVIIETGLLTEPAKELACLAAQDAGADFVKTSTGFSGGGASVEDITLMHQLVGDRLGIKASGGIRSYADALSMVQAGATRIGASASLDIVGASSTYSSDTY